MKGYIKGHSIILIDKLPENLKEGDEVEVFITPITAEEYPFPTFNLGVKDKYLKRENMYEQD